MSKFLSFTGAAEKVLKEYANKKPMHHKEIIRLALKNRWISTKGLTPETTLTASIGSENRRRQARSEEPRFIAYGKGLYGLSVWEPKGLAKEIQQKNKEEKKKLQDILMTIQPRQFEELIGEILAEAGVPLSYYTERLIKALASHNWYKQNPAASLLWNLGPVAMKGISPNNLEDLGRNILQSADGTAGDSLNFLRWTLDLSVQWPAPFIKGLLYECFLNENNKFRCKPGCKTNGNDTQVTSKAILIAIRCNEGDATILLDTLLRDIDKSKPKDELYTRYKIEETIELVNRTIQILTPEETKLFKHRLNSLVSKLSAIKKLGATISD